MSQVFLSRFTPSLMPPEALEGVFVQRERLTAHTTELIRDSILGASKSHTLLVGPRGIGKTHLVSLIYHRLRAMEDLPGRMAVAWLREEEWGVASFLDLLWRILRVLAEEDPALMPRVTAVHEAATPAAAERAARALLVEIIGGRTLFLIAENLDDLFAGLGDEGQKRLRSFLQETRFTTILATTPSLFGGVSRQTSPFYGFFRVQHLSGLSLEDATLLLTKIAQLEADASLEAYLQSPAGRARVRALHHLAGGNPRVYVIFSEFLTRESLDELVTPFLKMLDELTPYYQAKMRSLSAQQRKIIEILVEARGTLSVKEIGQRSFISPQTVSSQLKELREKGYVIAHSIGREAFYELQEPLMRLCLEVKKQRGDTIKLFVEFLRLWCSRDELERRLASLPPDAVFTANYLREAIRLSESDGNPLITACLADYKVLVKKKEPQELSRADHEKALQVLEEMIAIRGKASDWAMKGWHLDQLEDCDGALVAAEYALTLDPKNVIALKCKGLILSHMGRKESALTALDEALLITSSDAGTWSLKSITLNELGRYEEALEASRHALLIDPVNTAALGSKSIALGVLGRYEQALANFNQIKSLIDAEPSFQLAYVSTLMGLQRWDEVITAIDKLLPHLGENQELLLSYTSHVIVHLSSSPINEWPGYVKQIISLYERHGRLLSLAQALVATSAHLVSLPNSLEVQLLWLEAWQQATQHIAEMQLPLRLLGAAVRYLNSGQPPDPRILLELPVEERTLLEPLLTAEKGEASGAADALPIP